MDRRTVIDASTQMLDWRRSLDAAARLHWPRPTAAGQLVSTSITALVAGAMVLARRRCDAAGPFARAGSQHRLLPYTLFSQLVQAGGGLHSTLAVLRSGTRSQLQSPSRARWCARGGRRRRQRQSNAWHRNAHADARIRATRSPVFWRMRAFPAPMRMPRSRRLPKCSIFAARGPGQSFQVTFQSPPETQIVPARHDARGSSTFRCPTKTMPMPTAW